MNSTKSAFLKRHQNRMMKKSRPSALEIFTTDFILEKATELANMLPMFGIDYAKGKDKMGISVISGQRTGKTQDFRIATAEETEFEEVDNINVALMGKAFHGTPVFVSEFTRSVRLWAIIRSYHLIEITIAIAVGVYLWLK